MYQDNKPCLTSPRFFFCLSPNGDKNPVAHDLHAGCRCRAEGAHAEKADRRSKKMPAGVAGTIILIFVLLPCRGDENDEKERKREREARETGKRTTGGTFGGQRWRIVTKEGKERDGWVLLCIIFVRGGVPREAKDSRAKNDSSCCFEGGREGYESARGQRCFAFRRIKRCGTRRMRRAPSSPWRNYPKERL